MSIPRKTMISRICVGALAVAAIAAPAFAQGQDEVTVTGRLRMNTEATASILVDYSDVDTSTGYGRNILNHRIFYTAADLCRRINQPTEAPAIVEQCRDEAFQDARMRVDTENALYVPSNTVWLR